MVKAKLNASLMKLLVQASGTISTTIVQLSFSADSFSWKTRDSEGRFFLIYQVSSSELEDYDVQSNVVVALELATLTQRFQAVSIEPDYTISIECENDSDSVVLEFHKPELGVVMQVEIEKWDGQFEAFEVSRPEIEASAATVKMIPSSLKEAFSNLSGDVEVTIDKKGVCVVETGGSATAKLEGDNIFISMRGDNPVCLRWRMEVLKPLSALMASVSYWLRIYAVLGGDEEPVGEGGDDDTCPVEKTYDDDTHLMYDDNNLMYDDTYLEGAGEGATYFMEGQDVSDSSQKEMDYGSSGSTSSPGTNSPGADHFEAVHIGAYPSEAVEAGAEAVEAIPVGADAVEAVHIGACPFEVEAGALEANPVEAKSDDYSSATIFHFSLNWKGAVMLLDMF